MELFEKGPTLLIEGMDPRAEALRLALRNCGMSGPPRADLRFQVEALWATLDIRFMLIQVAKDSAPFGRTAITSIKEVRGAWIEFISVMIQSIEHDAALAIRIAQSSQSHRQLVRSTLYLMRAQYASRDHAAARQGNTAAPQNVVEDLKAAAMEGSATAKKTMAETRRIFRDLMPTLEDQEWLGVNFVQPAEDVIAQWDELYERLTRGVFYASVSDEEKKAIFGAFSAGFFGIREYLI